MKIIGAWNFYEELSYNNYLFIHSDAPIGDGLLKPFNNLYTFGKKNNLDFVTLDMVKDFNEVCTFLFFDFPNMNNPYVKQAFSTQIPKYLFIFESALIRPDNWDLKKHKHFDKIFTWNDDFVDNKKYFKFNFAQNIPNSISKDLEKKTKLCTLIAGNKKVNHPLELYSKRVEAIKWFEKNHPQNFEFYGIGWDQYTHSNKYVKYLLNKTKLSALFKPDFKSYRGKIDSKKEVLENYRFAICYENARDIPGYITEKIFDCFFAGCVPIYWGADNITNFIPKECFIDKREFDSYEELYKYMSNMSEEEYLKYHQNIEIFLNSEEAYLFSSECFTKTIIGNIV